MPRLPGVEAMMASDEASRALGIEVVSYGAGRATTRMTVRADMVNGHDIAHGGLVFTLADTAFACACNSHGPVTVAAGAEIVFIAPGRLGDVLEAEAVERTVFGRQRHLRRHRAAAATRSRSSAAAVISSGNRASARARLWRPEGPRRGRPGHDVDSVLAVAVEVFNERGYDGTSMRDLSTRLGIAKSAIYHHVPGKEALLGMAVDGALDGLFEVAAEHAR